MVIWGALRILAGIFAAGAPFSFYAIIQLVAGFALIIHGFVHVFSYVRAPEALRSSSTLVSGILNALLGFMLLVLPSLLTVSTLVYLFAFLFILGGVDRLSYAHQMKRLEMPYAAAIAVGIITSSSAWSSSSCRCCRRSCWATSWRPISSWVASRCSSRRLPSSASVMRWRR